MKLRLGESVSLCFRAEGAPGRPRPPTCCLWGSETCRRTKAKVSLMIKRADGSLGHPMKCILTLDEDFCSSEGTRAHRGIEGQGGGSPGSAACLQGRAPDEDDALQLHSDYSTGMMLMMYSNIVCQYEDEDIYKESAEENRVSIF